MSKEYQNLNKQLYLDLDSDSYNNHRDFILEKESFGSIRSGQQYQLNLIEFGLESDLPESFKKSHQAVFSIHDQSRHEQNIFTIVNSKMHPSHWANGKYPIYEFKAAELSEWLGISSKHLGTTLKPAALRLLKRTVGVEVNEKGTCEFEYISLFSKISYRNAKLTVIPNPLVRDFLLEYSRGYADLNPRKMIKLKKNHSKRIYEMLSRFKETGTYLYPIKINKLQRYFGLFEKDGFLKNNKKSLKSSSVFVTRYISDAIKEISKVCADEIVFFEGKQGHLGFTPIKKGKQYEGVEFHYKWLKSNAKMTVDEAVQTIKNLEQKRLVNKIELTIKELDMLSVAYIKIKKMDKAALIIKVIQQRNELSKKIDKPKVEDKAKSVLDKIYELELLEPDLGY